MRVLFAILLLANLGLLALYPLPRTAADAGVVPPPSAPRLRLADEAQPSLHAAQECYSLAPTEDRPRIEAARRQLWAFGYNAHLSSNSQRALVGYWVYLPPASDRSRAEQVGRSLEEVGVTDYVLVLGAHRANAISLGLYRREENADARVAQVRALGFDPIKEPHFSKTEQLTLSIAMEDGEPPALEGLGGWQPVNCQGLAQ